MIQKITNLLDFKQYALFEDIDHESNIQYSVVEPENKLQFT